MTRHTPPSTRARALRRALLAAAAALAAPALAAAQSPQECAAGFFQPDPPIFRAQGRILGFAALPAAEQDLVQTFAQFPALGGGFEANAMIIPPGDPTADPGTAQSRYLKPGHPGAQPNTPMPAWRRVRCVAQPAGKALPFQWLRRDASPDANAAAFAASTLRTLPRITPPAFIRATYVRTGPSLFPGKADLDGDGVEEIVDSHATPPGTNMLPTTYANLRDRDGVEMVNTVSATKSEHYALHAGKPTAVVINPQSPIDDLRYILETLGEIVLDAPYRTLLLDPDGLSPEALAVRAQGAQARLTDQRSVVDHHLQWARDIITGRDGAASRVPGDRAYRGFPLLNHSGHKRVNRVMPVYDADGAVVGGEAVVRQVWYGGRIQSDTMFFDFGWARLGEAVDYVNCGGPGQPTNEACAAAAPIPPEKPWTIRYEINVLARGNDDFSPMTMHFDCPWEVTVNGVAVSGMAAGKPCADGRGPSVVKRSAAQIAYYDAAGQRRQLDLLGRWPEIAVKAGPLYASLDQTFFPMEDGTRVSVAVKMAPPQYYNLTYTWGWRNHPPRAQAIENAHKVVPPPLPFIDALAARLGMPAMALNMACHPLGAGIVAHEQWAFEGLPPGDMPTGLAMPDSAKAPVCLNAFREMTGNPGATMAQMMQARLGLLRALYGERGAVDAIDRIGDLAPAKRMWRAFGAMQAAMAAPGVDADAAWLRMLLDARDAYLDWMHRTRLPSGVAPDPASDVTLLFVNNTLYGQITGGGYLEMPGWRRRGDLVKVTLLNGDYFPHGYLNVDFGGARGWENTFKSSVKTAGSGAWFTFGRFHARFNTTPGTILVDKAEKGAARTDPEAGGAPDTVTPGVHRVMMEMNFEPSPRLRMYQFDPLHHDAAIFSLH